jgi:hypothetical protein
MSATEPRSFEPKVPVKLEEPKSDPISPERLAQCDGSNGNPTYVAIKVRFLRHFPSPTPTCTHSPTHPTFYQLRLKKKKEKEKKGLLTLDI